MKIAHHLTSENPQTYDSQSNGGTEIGVKIIRGMFRTMRLCLQARICKKIPITHLVMAWLMKHESDSARGRAEQENDGNMAHLDVAVAWVTPSASPLWKAVAFGTEMLKNENVDAHWSSTTGWYVGPKTQVWQKIQQAVLPQLARIWWRGICAAESWPLRLLHPRPWRAPRWARRPPTRRRRHRCRAAKPP